MKKLIVLNLAEINDLRKRKVDCLKRFSSYEARKDNALKCSSACVIKRNYHSALASARKKK
jgi:hypothetical protein